MQCKGGSGCWVETVAHNRKHWSSGSLTKFQRVFFSASVVKDARAS